MANDPADPIREIRGMRFPPGFVELWSAGKWRQPDEALIQSLIPWLQGPIEFIESMHRMVTDNQVSLADDPNSARVFHEYRGRLSSDKLDLPWLDIERALYIAVNRIPGDDLGIAMDFRTSIINPRVVASYWLEGRETCHVEWRLVTETFAEFVARLNMVDCNKNST